MKVGRLSLALAVVALLQVSAFATVLAPGGCVGASTVTCPGTLTVFNDAGLTLLASRTDPVTVLSGTYSGTFRSAVYREASGFLDFYYQLSNNAGSNDSVQRITMNPFTGFLTDVGYRGTLPSPVGPYTTTGTEVPLFADRDLPDGSTVGFQFFDVASPNQSTKIGPNETSSIMVIKTNATAFTTGFVSVIDGGATQVLSFAPSSGIPEPATNMMLGAGLTALAFLLRKTRKK